MINPAMDSNNYHCYRVQYFDEHRQQTADLTKEIPKKKYTQRESDDLVIAEANQYLEHSGVTVEIQVTRVEYAYIALLKKR